MTEKTLTTENIKPALDALRGELAPWPVMAMKQDRLNDTQKSAVNSGITSSLVAQIIANTAAIRALESAITGTGLRALVVASLPATGTQGILYIVPVTTYDPATDADVVNYSNEYIWIVAPDAPVTEGYYEQVGQTGIVINNGQLTITVNGTSVGTFTANQSGDTTAAITVPTNADYVDKTTAQSIAGVKTFSDGIVSNVTGNVTGDLTGTASKAIADEDGTSIKTGYGKLAGNQTWTGSNTFTDSLTFKNNAVVVGATTGYGYSAFNYVDSNNSSIAYHRVSKFTSGNTCLQWKIYNTNNNSESISAEIQYYLTKTGERVFTPNSNGDTTLGTSSYRWSSVYADSYYYGTTAFTDKFVTTDTSQTISGAKTFSTPIKTAGHKLVGDFTDLNDAYYNNEVCGFAPTIANNPTGGYGTVWTVNAAVNVPDNPYTSWINQLAMFATGMKRRYRSNAGAWTSWENILTESNAKPSTNGTLNLGTSTYKWKTLNGINPGALSLPNYDETKALAVDTTGWTYDGSTANQLKINNAIQTINGWLFIRIENVASTDRVIIRFNGNLASDPAMGFSPAGTGINLIMPIPANKITNIYLTKSPLHVKFYPCLGNV